MEEAGICMMTLVSISMVKRSTRLDTIHGSIARLTGTQSGSGWNKK